MRAVISEEKWQPGKRSALFPLYLLDSLVDRREDSEDDHGGEDAFGGLCAHAAAALEDTDDQGQPDADGNEGYASF